MSRTRFRTGHGTRRTARWIVVVVLAAAVGAAPWVVGRVEAAAPADSDDVSAATLLAEVRHADGMGWSGYAESRGGLALPVTTVFPDLVDLAGGTTTMRAWWRTDSDWRVDELSAVGEKDTVRDDTGTWAWDYQRARATRTEIPADDRVRLPRSSDLLPPELGGRLASEATDAEVSRLPGRTIAGRATLGLRIVPSQPQSSVDRVDIWADSATGLPLRVEVWGAGASRPAMATTFLDVSVATPTPAQVQFTPPPDATTTLQNDPSRSDIASAIDRYARARPPSTLAGLDRSDRTPGLGAVGVYGRGVTELVAVPLLQRFTGSLRTQLASAGTAVTDAQGNVALGVGPLNLLVTPVRDDGRFWLLAGTVTPATLLTAAAEVATIPEVRR